MSNIVCYRLIRKDIKYQRCSFYYQSESDTKWQLSPFRIEFKIDSIPWEFSICKEDINNQKTRKRFKLKRIRKVYCIFNSSGRLVKFSDDLILKNRRYYLELWYYWCSDKIVATLERI